jgi:hypothetical protein
MAPTPAHRATAIIVALVVVVFIVPASREFVFDVVTTTYDAIALTFTRIANFIFN